MLIGEVSRRAGISTRMLRHYDSMKLVTPGGRTAGGYREYSPADIRRLFLVESLRSLGLSLRDLQRALDDPDFSPGGIVAELMTRTQQRIDRDEELLRRLREVASSEPTEWPEVLRVIALMRGLESDSPSRRQRTALATVGDTVPPTLLARAVLGEADPNVSGALRWALRRSGDAGLAVLGPALDDADGETRLRAVTAIAEIDSEAAASWLGGALLHSDPVVRRHATLVLGTRGDVRAMPELIQMIVAGDHDVEAAEALGVIAREHRLDDRAAGALIEELGRMGVSPESRLRLIQALAELGGEVVEEALRTLSDDPDRATALTAEAILRSRHP